MAQQRRYAAGEPALGPGETLRFLAGRLLPGLRLAGCHAGIAGLVLVGLLGPSPGGPYGWLVLVTSAVTGVTWLLVAPWSVVFFERDGRVGAALPAAYRLALSRPELALLAAAVVPAAVVAGPSLAVRVPYAGPLLLVALPAAVASLVVRLGDRAGALRDVNPSGRIGSGSVPSG
ncbi:hypothetical protein ACFQYP_27335 [Nonomuraea antimicrobica]